MAAVVDVRPALARITRNLTEVEQLINDRGNVLTAKDILQSTKRNLNRVRNYLTPARFLTISSSISQLLAICNERSETGTRQPAEASYTAPRTQTGQRGRPPVAITREQLLVFHEKRYSAPQIAKQLNCSASVVYKRCREERLSLGDRFTQLDDAELKRKIQILHDSYPNAGSVMMQGHLQANGIFVQRARVRQLLADIDPVGTANRWGSTVKRRKYSVPTPNWLWHMDAHLKLVRWGFVTHGCIDGYSRQINYLHCCTSILSEAVVKLFLGAVTKFGVPGRVRSDHGYENFLVAVFMEVVRGGDRGSHITGRSVHNQRIERMWVDVYRVVAQYHELFYHFEDRSLLNPTSKIDLFALQQVYLPAINASLLGHMSGWNKHKIRTEHHQTPEQIWLDGMLQNCNRTSASVDEVFNLQHDIATRLCDALYAHGVDVQNSSEPIERECAYTATLDLTEDQSREVEGILSSSEPLKEKYERLVTKLRDMNVSDE